MNCLEDSIARMDFRIRMLDVSWGYALIADTVSDMT
jgi:hypothetical protein